MAGLRAAYEASKKGLNVYLASKQPLARANNTFYSGAGILCPKPGGPPPQEHFRMIVNAGRHLNNQGLVWTVVNNIGGIMQELLDAGLKVNAKSPSTEYHVEGPMWAWGGELLRTHLELIGNRARFQDNVSIFKLLVDDGVCSGALGYDASRDEMVAIWSKATVLCSGGCAGLYRRTTNAPGQVGDGYGMAYDAGVELQDMEFIQFLGTSVARKPMFRLNRVVGALLNSRGEDVCAKYGMSPTGSWSDDPVALSRDRLAVAMMKEIEGGRGVDGGLLMDLSHEQKWMSEFRPLTPYLVKRFGDERKRVLMIPSAHYCMGGVVIDGSGRTGVKGLYAAGEVTGGVDGANRVSGNALAACMVYGALAGRNAAAYAQARQPVKIGDVPKAYVEDFGDLKKANGPVNPRSVLEKIRRTMWKHAGVLRSREGLGSGLEDLKAIAEEDIPRLTARNNVELKTALGVMNGITTAIAIDQVALHREESRGAHCRLDFPHPDDEHWLKNIVISKKGNRMDLRTRPIVTIEIKTDRS